MKIEKLPSGNYRIRQQYNGKRYSVTLDYKPTTKEATMIMAEKLALSGVKANGRMTVLDASRQYIESRSNILSPTTLREYRRTVNYLERIEPDFMGTHIDKIEQNDIQCVVNRLAADKSPKTVRNYSGFIGSVFASYRPSFVYRVDLPMKRPAEAYTPNLEDVQRILKAVEGTRYDVPFHLAVFGLRRSEICALTEHDLDGNQLRINKALVWDGSQWVTKDYPKTTESFRTIYLPDYLVDKFHRLGAPDVYINHINDHLHAVQDSLGIKRFRLHDFRHFFASYSHAIGLSDADIMAVGGWKTDHVMKSVYRQAMKTEEAMKIFADSVTTS
jgi:integrase